MATRQPELLDELVNVIAELAAMVASLDSDLNSHRLAKYELAGGLDCLHRFLSGGNLIDQRNFARHLDRSARAMALVEREPFQRVAVRACNGVGSLDEAERRRLLSKLLVRPTTMSPQAVPQPAIMVPKDRDDIEPISPAVDVTALVRILEGLPRGFQRWSSLAGREAEKTQGWMVESEKHVQALLWLVLAPVFKDLVYEDSISKVGARKPRPDFALRHRGVAVEVKYLRGRADFSRVVEEVAADVGLYLRRGSTYQYLVVFVWDESCSTELHEELKSGLKEVGATEAVVMSQPGILASKLRTV